MKNAKYVVMAVAVSVVTLGLLWGCASSGGRCNTDACYSEREKANDAFNKAEVVAWGVTEKQGQDEQKRKERDLASVKESAE